jgi:capsular polysaccharide biosynthesis protein
VLVVAAYIIATYSPPGATYQVVMRLAAGTEPAALSADYDRYYPWLTSEYVANGLADIAETGVFAGAVASRLAAAGYNVASGAVQAAIVTDNAQSILVIYLTWPDEAQIVALADAVTAELTGKSAAYFPQLAGIEPAVRLLDEPAAIRLPRSLRAQLTGPAIRIGLAVIVGVGLALLWHYLDPAIRDAAELEAMEIVVLGEIPRRRWRKPR